MKATINSTDINAFKNAALLTKTGISMVKTHPMSIEFTSSKDLRKYTHGYKIYKDENGLFRLRRIVYDWQYGWNGGSKGKLEYQLGRTHNNYHKDFWPTFSSVFDAIKWFEGYVERNKTRWIKAAAK